MPSQIGNKYEFENTQTILMDPSEINLVLNGALNKTLGPGIRENHKIDR